MRLTNSGKDSCSIKSKPTALAAIFGAALCVNGYAGAGEVRVNAGVSADWTEQSITQTDGNPDFDSSNQIIKPFAEVSYLGKKLRGTIRGTHNHIRRQLESDNGSQNYTELQYSGSYEAIRNLLNFNVNGSQSFRSEFINSFRVDDFLLNAENLNKTTSTQISANLDLPRGKYFGLSASTAYSVSNSDQNGSNTSSIQSVFDSTSYSTSISAISGKSITGLRTSIGASVNFVDRGVRQNFNSQTLTISNRINVYKELGIAINGSYENNEADNDSDVQLDTLREFYSIGAGLVWQSSANRSLEIALNRSFREIPNSSDTEEDNFVSYDINWAFSNRTNLQASFTKRFFGDAGNVVFSHQLRNWRSSVTYTESVNTTSQLANNSSLALFVCDGDTTNIANCTLSDSLQPELAIGQVLQPFTIQSFELNDQIILSKSLIAQTAITRRRTTFSITGTKSDIEELEQDRTFETENISAQLSFEISSRTTLSLSSSYTSIDSVVFGEPQNQITREHSISLSRQLSRAFSTSVSFRRLQRVGDVVNRGGQSFGGINGPFTDNRVTVGVSYSFGNGA